MENMAIRFGTDAGKKLDAERKKDKEEKEKTDYIRSTLNPLYNMDKKEAMEYAAKMGMSDTARGIGQAFSSAVGWDEASDWLKSKDDTLRAIFENEEYGQEAMVNFLGTAVVADPVSYVPILGWVSKGKKAKNLWDNTETLMLDKELKIMKGMSPLDFERSLSEDKEFAQWPSFSIKLWQDKIAFK